MKLNRKLFLVLALVLSVAMATTGTLAYLTDRDSDANQFTVGDVKIELNEEYIEPSELLPNVDIDKVATISNTGKNSAYVWGTIAVPDELKDVLHLEMNEAEEWDWNTVSRYTTEIEGSQYYVYTGLYNPVLVVGQTTSEMMSMVTLDEFVDIAPDGKMYRVYGGETEDLNWNINDKSKPVVYVSAYALQSDGVEGGVHGAYELYSQQWGDPAEGASDGMATPDNNEFVVQNSDELREALDTIKNNEEYWNRDIVIKLAGATYDGDFTIYQYPEWNEIVGAGNTDNNHASLNGDENVTHITIMASDNVTFTGNVYVNGFGNAGTGFGNAKASTTFSNIIFDGTNSVEENGKDSIVVYAQAGASNVNFFACEFKNATHITVGHKGADAVGAITFDQCGFNDGGCISGYAETMVMNNPQVTAASNGFISNQKAGTITVNGGEINCTEYAFRTQNSNININVTGAEINVAEDSEGTAALVIFRGAGPHTATFENCTLNYTQESTGTGTITIHND